MFRDRSRFYESLSNSVNDLSETYLMVEHSNRWFHLVDLQDILSETKDLNPFDSITLHWTYKNNPPLHVQLATYQEVLQDLDFDDFLDNHFCAPPTLRSPGGDLSSATIRVTQSPYKRL